MALQKEVTSGFRNADIITAHFQRFERRVEVLDEDGEVTGHAMETRVDCDVTFIVRDGGGVDTLEQWVETEPDTGASFGFINAAFRARAWDNYKTARGYTEV